MCKLDGGFVLVSDGGGLGQGGGLGNTGRKTTNFRLGRLGAVSFVHLCIPGFQNSAWNIICTLKILVESLNE